MGRGKRGIILFQHPLKTSSSKTVSPLAISNSMGSIGRKSICSNAIASNPPSCLDGSFESPLVTYLHLH